MSEQQAKEADREGRIVEAADLYEESLRSGGLSIEGLMDLAILYWQATDFGFLVCNGLPDAFVGRASERFSEILERALERFPESIEPRFWDRYIRWADYGAPFERDECVEMFDAGCSVAAMMLFGMDDEQSYRAEALELLDQYKAHGTTRAQYISSVIESALTHYRKP